MGTKHIIKLDNTAASGGYLWFPVPNDYYILLKENSLIVNGGVDTSDEILIGAGHTAVFEIEALTDEEFDILFRLKQPWDGGDIAEEQIIKIN
jgi:hypothetical protein